MAIRWSSQFAFAMYNVATDGASEWSEVHQDMVLAVFLSRELGSINPLPGTLLNLELSI